MKIEETLWIALRMFEERRNLLMTMATAKGSKAAETRAERAEESMVHIRRIRAMLTRGDKVTTSVERHRQPAEGGERGPTKRKRSRPPRPAKAGRTLVSR